jgi:hypothetical protein
MWLFFQIQNEVQIDALDNVIAAFIVLFILSAITEKFVGLFRRYPRECSVVAYIGLITFIHALLPTELWLRVSYFVFVALIVLYYIFRKPEVQDQPPTHLEKGFKRVRNLFKGFLLPVITFSNLSIFNDDPIGQLAHF